MTRQPASTGDTGDQLPVDIHELAPGDLRAAAAVLTQGMLDNPLHLRVFGDDSELRGRRLSRFLGPLVDYVHSNGIILGAYVQGELIGVLGMIKPGRCRPGLSDRLRIGISLLTGASPTTLWRLQRWLAAWARNDPDELHWHIGPLAVLPDYRRRGIGRRLMQCCCQRMDALEVTAWLETDLEINAGFYRTLGFDPVRMKPVLGVPTWFMRRAPILPAAQPSHERVVRAQVPRTGNR